MELACRPSEREGERAPDAASLERGPGGVEAHVYVRVWSPDWQETGYAAVFALEMHFDSEHSYQGLESVLSVDLTGRGRFEDLRVIHRDSAERKRRPGGNLHGGSEAFYRQPTLTPRPCETRFRTAASDVLVQEASSVLGLPLDMGRSEIMTICRTMLLTYVATSMPTLPSHGEGCEWWQWAPRH